MPPGWTLRQSGLSGSQSRRIKIMEQADLRLETVQTDSPIPKKIVDDGCIEDIISKLISDDFQMMLYHAELGRHMAVPWQK